VVQQLKLRLLEVQTLKGKGARGDMAQEFWQAWGLEVAKEVAKEAQRVVN